MGEGSREARRKMRDPEKTASAGWGGQCGDLKTKGMRTVSKGVKTSSKRLGISRICGGMSEDPPKR